MKIMQATQNISQVQVREIVEAIYDQGPVVVKQANSDLGRAPRQFIDANALIDALRFQPGQEYVFFSYVIYYPEAGGHTYEKRITFNPEFCDGPPLPDSSPSGGGSYNSTAVSPAIRRLNVESS
jgi:hypothetical protein